ncbi:MAG: hypothetical protein B5M53_02220 [Candidatus Cloacimonas sp. 4484_209]|nr:MAG: hypothetical protein B5M53_02220 [Candidatus Cloacimonas sp. 4484_209]
MRSYTYYPARIEKLIIILILILLPGITLRFLSYPTIGVILYIGSIWATIVLFYPILGLLTMVFLIPLEILTVLSSSATLIKILGLWTFLAWLLHYKIMLREPLRISNVFWLALIFCIWAWASILWSTNQEASLSRFINLALLIGLYFLITNLIDSNKRFELVLGAYILGCFICGLLATKTFLTTGLFSSHSRMSLTGQNPNTMGVIMALGTMFSWYLFSKTKGSLYRLIVLVLSMFFIYVLIMSQSRGAWVAFIIASGFYSWPMIKKINFRNILILILLIACVIIVIVLLSHLFPQMTPFLQKRFLSIFQSESLSTRSNIWRVGIEMWKDNPIFGVGLNNFHWVFNKYLDIPFGLTRYPGAYRDPHNVYLCIICELGLVGFTIFVVMLYSFFTTLRKNEQLLKTFMTSIFVLILVVGLKGTIVWSKYYWLVLGLIGASLNFGKQLDQFPIEDIPV